MSTSKKTHALWDVRIKEAVVAGTVIKTEGSYVVRVLPSEAIAYLQRHQLAGNAKEEAITESTQAWVARDVVQWRFHMKYSGAARVAVTCSSSAVMGAEPERQPDDLVAGIALWKIAAT